MTRCVSSRDNLRILINLLRESSKSIQIEAFHVFKLYTANQNKPPDVVSILVANRSKLLRLFADFKTDKEDEPFEADKAQVKALMMKEEYEQATVKNVHVSLLQGSNEQPTEKWTPPAELAVKINSDAAVSLYSDRAGMAVVCRDSRGFLHDGLTFKQAVASVLMAEALALRAAIGTEQGTLSALANCTNSTINLDACC
ncbi:hypothetical protein SLEP1_g25871 [Rubroshorea leprosula]|uniref:RNase H type-1 domain-containing protein n=1 Tax=Rubroshorea leprosula TaxID=152421 RepID=A0AAV5JK25_9ROSI|nr:hypothetical protein SLEP1_g25871 [Rubroshorea leprosula]